MGCYGVLCDAMGYYRVLWSAIGMLWRCYGGAMRCYKVLWGAMGVLWGYSLTMFCLILSLLVVSFLPRTSSLTNVTLLRYQNKSRNIQIRFGQH